MVKLVNFTGLTRFLENVRSEIFKNIFESKYSLYASTTNITKSNDGNVQSIVEENDLGSVETEISKVNNVTSITTTLIPVSGKYNYIKSVTISNTDTGKLITESYTRSVK